MAKRSTQGGYTRRDVLERGLTGSLLALGSTGHLWTRSVESVWAEVGDNTGKPVNPVLSAQQKKWMLAIVDQIVPPGDGMPGAGEVGAVDYIAVVLKDVPELRATIIAALKEIRQSSESKFQAEPNELSADQLVEVLKSFEASSIRSGQESVLAGDRTDVFATLRDLIYEAYYTSPKVWPLLGYKFDTVEKGTEMKPFDERILDVVRKRPRNYRQTE